MEWIEIRLNNFLFNSGILGFCKIIDTVDKNELLKEEGNMIKVAPEIFENFEDDYIKTMLYTFEEDTRWYSIISRKEEIQKLDMSNEGNVKILNDFYKFLKKSLESASYKAGFEIAKVNDSENPYEYIAKVKEANTKESVKENSLKIIEYLKKHKEIYCMKDIMYNKINMFWENVSFFGKKSNTKDIKGEYKEFFVVPVQKYLSKKQNGDYNCIECGNVVIKDNAYSMTWLKDTGVDFKKKTSAFWDFHEDAFICPICKLIYSCVPLGFTIVGNSSIFINQNNSIKALKQDNHLIEGRTGEEKKELEELENIQYKLFIKLLDRFNSKSNEEVYEKEIHNVQIIKRRAIERDNIKYEFNMISKEKLKAFEKSKKDFEVIVGKVVYIDKKPIKLYEEVLSNFLESRNQYELLNLLINEKENNGAYINYLKNILNIQINSKGGKDMSEEKEFQELKEKMMKAGRILKVKYLAKDENKNKLRAYVLQLTNNLRTNNVDTFMDIVTRMYGSLGEAIPCAEGFSKMLIDKRYFRDLGYAYVIGLEAYIGENDEKKGGSKDEK